MRFTSLRLAPLWATLTVSGPSLAAASLLVDDAGTTPESSCQLESWIRNTTGHSERTAVPACTVAGTEWSFSLSHLRGSGDTPWAIGAKRTLRGWHADRIQLAGALQTGGDLRHGGARGWAINVPLSIAVDRQGDVLIHANTGWVRSRTERGMTFGAGTEIRIAPRWSVLAEQFRDAARQRSSQLGVRRLLRNDASLDLLVGYQHGATSDSWLTVGLNLPLTR